MYIKNNSSLAKLKKTWYYDRYYLSNPPYFFFRLFQNSINCDHKYRQLPTKKIVLFRVFFSKAGTLRLYLNICECWLLEPYIQYSMLNKYLFNLRETFRRNIILSNKQNIDFNTLILSLWLHLEYKVPQNIVNSCSALIVLLSLLIKDRYYIW